jgi:Cft2 family RNA processing exonuclease
VNRAVADGGHILVPAFAIGRTQTLIYHLNTLIEARRIPDIGVAVDSPLGLRVTELYQRARPLFDQQALRTTSVATNLRCVRGVSSPRHARRRHRGRSENTQNSATGSRRGARECTHRIVKRPFSARG